MKSNLNNACFCLPIRLHFFGSYTLNFRQFSHPKLRQKHCFRTIPALQTMVLFRLTMLGPNDICVKYQIDRTSNTKVIYIYMVFQILGVLVFQLFQKVPNTGLVVMTTKTRYCRDVSWPKQPGIGVQSINLIDPETPKL